MFMVIAVLPVLCAWVDPVDLGIDIHGETSITIEQQTVKSCKPAAAIGAAQCHRWNLVWEPVKDLSGLVEQDSWETNLDDDSSNNEWRLPTIKELSKLISFGVSNPDSLIESSVIKDWFTSDNYWSDNSVFLNDGTKAVWLISSTFRDIDGDDSGRDYAQIFAINIINGEIKTFETDSKGAFLGKQLNLCESLNSDGSCNYAADTPQNDVFALKVRTQLVKDLL